jgi:hypothetical protein
MSAQGNALGLQVPITINALKGRNRIGVRIFVAPFQGMFERCVSLPRALPGADMLVPHSERMATASRISDSRPSAASIRGTVTRRMTTDRQSI